MPSYEYDIPEAGRRITLIRPVARRDDPVHVHRVTVPQSIAIAGAAANPLALDAQIARGYARMEERGELNKPRSEHFTPDQIKNAPPPYVLPPLAIAET